MKTFFQKIDTDRMNNWPVDYLRPLINALIAKFPTDLKALYQMAKNDNPFGLDLEASPFRIEYGMTNILLEELSAPDAASAALSPLPLHPKFQNGFGLKLLVNAYKTFDKDNKQNMLSEKSIKFSMYFLNELKEANKCETFLGKMLDFNDKGPVTNAIKTFINSCIIGVLRYYPQDAKKILDFLTKHSGMMIVLKPTKDSPNPVLNDNLSDVEKNLFLKWSANEKTYISGAEF